MATNFMKPEIYRLHINAGRKAGIESTCGEKQKHVTEEDAIIAAKRMNKSGNAFREVEAYPCAFCGWWHIGGRMAHDELIRYVGKRI
jgi:deoxycytidylate deaminase